MKKLAIAMWMIGCAPPPPPPPPVTVVAPAVVATVSASAPAPPPAPPSEFRFVTDVPADHYLKIFRLPDGIALVESTDHGWQVRMAHGAGDLTWVQALNDAPESKKALSPLFAGELGTELWLSFLDDGEMPKLDFITFRIDGANVKRTTGKWYRALAAQAGGAVALPSHTSPVYLADDEAQKLEIIGGAKAAKIPPNVRLYDIDILPTGEIHALAAVKKKDSSTIVGFVSVPGAEPRVMAMPSALGTEQPILIHGSNTFLANNMSTWIGEKGGALVTVEGPPVRSASVGKDGELWLVEGASKAAPTLRRARIDFEKRTLTTIAALPFPRDVRGTTCRELGSAQVIEAFANGVVWLDVSCVKGPDVILRAAF